MLVALVLAQTGMSLLMPRGDDLTIASDVIQGTLLLVATAAFFPNIARKRCPTFNIRLFWILLSAGMVFWLTYQGMWNYFEVVKQVEVPDLFLGDVVLFLHLVPMIAALAVLPHLQEDERDERIRLLDFALLLTWWVFIYVYSVIPWQAVQVDEASYSANFNFAYLTEKLVILAALGLLVYTARGGWRRIYAQLLGASGLYAFSSYFANWAIGHKIYYSGSLYDIPLSVSIAWMGAVPLLSLHQNLTHTKPSRPVLGVWITRLSMAALMTLLWAAMHADLDPAVLPPVKAFRITASLLTMVVMGVVVFWRQRLLREELSLFLRKSRRSFDELKALQDQLIQSEKLASLGQLVGGAAHEINNPLTAMLGYSDLLSASGLPPEEQRQAVHIGEQVRQTTTLVASLLTFAQQAPARLAAVDVNSVLQTAVRLLGPQLEAQKTSIHMDLAPSLPMVLADANQILHVCIHLAGQINADLNGKNQSTLRIRTESDGKRVRIDFLSGDNAPPDPSLPSTPMAWMSRPEDAAKPTTLSLSACWRIVEEHGGRLLQPSNAGAQAFRLELRPATNTSASSAFIMARQASAHSTS